MVGNGLVGSILHVGIGPIVASANSSLYPFVIAALATLFLLTLGQAIGNAIRTARREHPGRGTFIVGTLIGLVVLLPIVFVLVRGLPVYAIWVAYSTPLDRLPFAPPGAAVRWWFLPALDTYIFVAVLAHGALSLLGAWALTIFTLPFFGINKAHIRPISLAYIVAAGGVVYGWEVHHWPLAFLIPAEVLLGVLISAWVITVLFGPQVKGKTGLFKMGLVLVLYGCGAAAIWFAHPIDAFFINALGIYLIFTPIDAAMAAFAGMFDAEGDEYDAQVPERAQFYLFGLRRWSLTSLLVIGIGTLGMAGAFASLIANQHLDYTVWLETGVAALAFMIFRPAADEARVHLLSSARSGAEDLMEVMKTVQALRGGEHRALPDPRQGQVVDALQYVDADGTADPAPSNDGDGPNRPAQELQAAFAAARDQARAIAVQVKLFDMLNFPAFFVFLLLALAYHYFSLNTYLATALNSALYPLMFGGISVVATLLPLVNYEELRQCSNIALRILLITLGVTLLSVALTATPGASQSAGITHPALSDLADPHFVVVSLSSAARELLLLLSAGQLLYLFQVNNVITRLERRRRA